MWPSKAIGFRLTIVILFTPLWCESLIPSTTSAKYASGLRATEPKKEPFIFPDVDSIGIRGRWEELDGNYLLRPPTDTAPLGVIHFLGGAFVGAAPHITYRYLLERLSEANYLVVATPFRLDMDYIRSCDAILTRFDSIGSKLAQEYGPLPVVGLGHSCGALLQTLVTCLFPSAPRAANILISFNNRPASRAIPLFQELIIPVAEQIYSNDERSVSFRESLLNFRASVDAVFDSYSNSAVAPSFVGKEVLPFVRQGLEIIDQLPFLLKIISDGKQEFEPTPNDTKEVCRRMYRARRTLLIKFSDDSLDESEDIEKVLREANTIMRMKRPMVEMEVMLRMMSGTHITPLTQNILLDPPPNIPVPDALLNNPIRQTLRTNFLRTVDEVVGEILSFLDLSMAPDV